MNQQIEQFHRNQAFEMVRQMGFDAALDRAESLRDMNAMGTYSYATHNAVAKAIIEFRDAGAMFRTVA